MTDSGELLDEKAFFAALDAQVGQRRPVQNATPIYKYFQLVRTGVP